MITENDLVRVSSEGKILLEILKELNKLNFNIEALRQDFKLNNINIPFDDKNALRIDFEGMKRPELMKLVTELDNKPEGWTKFTNKDLIKILKEG